MYEEIENIIVRTLSPYEYIQLEKLKEKYSEQQIIDAYKTAKVKNVNYITKILQNIKVKPEWLDKEITNQEIDEDAQKEYDEFNNFLKEFRNE